MPKLLLKFPSRSRPYKMFNCLDNIKHNIGISNYCVALTLDLDDLTVNNDEVKNGLRHYDNVIIYWGLSRGKINSINRSLPMSFEWSYMMAVADDMVFIKRNFGKTIIDAFEKNPDAGLLHFPDQKTGEKIVTLPIMTREYYSLFDYIYNPDYDSVYADLELKEVAQKLGKYKFIDEHIFRHDHPRWLKTPYDDLLKKTEDPKLYSKDKATYHRRRLINFEL